MAASRTLKALGAACVLSCMAQDPWAVRVVSYTPGTAYSGYTIPESALGRPTVDTYADATSSHPTVAVVPVYPPWDPLEIVSIGEGGSLVLEMGQDITNDPANPYGVDFLVFGNCMLFIKSGGFYDQNANTPVGYSVSGGINQKTGVVSVSADGETWFTFNQGPYVGGMLPTLGRVWLGTHWGDPTDPTLPPDPALASSQLADMPLDALCRRYRGGAGGTGFDLANLNAAPGQPLPSSFRYVRIHVPDDGNPLTNRRTEIDAVTVVRPVSSFVRWQQQHFAWTRDPADEAPAANPDGDTESNWHEFAKGGNPVVQDTPSSPRITLLPTGLVSLDGGNAEAWQTEATSTLEDPDSWVPVELPEALLQGVRLYRLRLKPAP